MTNIYFESILMAFDSIFSNKMRSLLTTRKHDGPPYRFLFGLASDGVYICPFCYQKGGELLPRRFTLTSRSWRLFSVALAWESPPPDVIRHPALRSSDFPHLGPFGISRCDHLCYSYYVLFDNNLI